MKYFKLVALNRGNVKWMLKEFRDGRLHYGWSFPECNLNVFPKKEKNEWTPKQKLCWKYTQFLVKRISIGDRIILQLHQPLRKFLLAEVTDEYYFQDPPDKDFNHILPVEPITENYIDLNSKIVPGYLRHALTKRGQYYEIYPQEAIDQLDRIIKKELWISHEAKKERSFNTELTRTKEEVLKSIKNSIFKHWQSTDFETFVAKLFALIPNVEVKTKGDSGLGWDLMLRIIDPITGETLDEKVPVQCKAYQGKVSSLKAIQDIERALKNSGANRGYIAILGELTDGFNEALSEKESELTESLGRNINIQVVNEDDFAELFLNNESQFHADPNVKPAN